MDFLPLCLGRRRFFFSHVNFLKPFLPRRYPLIFLLSWDNRNWNIKTTKCMDFLSPRRSFCLVMHNSLQQLKMGRTGVNSGVFEKRVETELGLKHKLSYGFIGHLYGIQSGLIRLANAAHDPDGPSKVT